MIPEEEEIPEPDPELVREFMFEAISAVAPKVFRPDQDAHLSYGMTPPREEASSVPGVIFGASAFLAGAVTGAAINAIWERRRHR